jgi:hypothetical protein
LPKALENIKSKNLKAQKNGKVFTGFKRRINFKEARRVLFGCICSHTRPAMGDSSLLVHAMRIWRTSSSSKLLIAINTETKTTSTLWANLVTFHLRKSNIGGKAM